MQLEGLHDATAMEAARALVLRAGFWGVITVELRRNPAGEKLKFIKTDPRVMRTTSLGTALGMDVGLALYTEFSGKASSHPRSYPAGVGWIWLSAYVQGLWKNRKDTRIRNVRTTESGFSYWHCVHFMSVTVFDGLARCQRRFSGTQKVQNIDCLAVIDGLPAPSLLGPHLPGNSARRSRRPVTPVPRTS